MKIKTNNIFPEVVTVENNYFEDSRGSFFKVFEDAQFLEFDIDLKIKQINISNTDTKGTFRGLHFQYPPYSEIKGIQCISGEILDVFVDIRKDSKTYLQHGFERLNKDKKQILILPKGFAHGFITLTDKVTLLYLHDQPYVTGYEGGLNIYDPKLNIKLPEEILLISDRDKNHSFINNEFNLKNI